MRRALGCLVIVCVASLASCGSTGHDRSSPAAARDGARPAPQPPASVPSAEVQVRKATWNLPSAVSRPAAVTEGSSILLLGGLTTGDVSTAAVYRLDPSKGSGALAGHLERVVHDAAGGSIGGQAIVFGGGSSSTTALVQSWSTGTAMEVASLPRPRSDLAATSIGDTTFLVGGFDGTTIDPVVLATSTGKSFVAAGSLAQPVRYPAVAAAAGAIWVIGGVTGTSEGSTEDTDVIQRIDGRTGQVSVVGHLPMALAHAAAIDVNGQLLVAGGRVGATPSDQVFRVDTSTGGVMPVGTLPEPRSDAGSAVIGDTAYLLGGELDGPTHPLDSVVEIGIAP